MTRWNTDKSLPRLAVYFSRTTSKQARASKQAAERERASERASEQAEEQRQGVHRSSSWLVYTLAKPARKIGQVGRRGRSWTLSTSAARIERRWKEARDRKSSSHSLPGLWRGSCALCLEDDASDGKGRKRRTGEKGEKKKQKRTRRGETENDARRMDGYRRVEVGERKRGTKDGRDLWLRARYTSLAALIRDDLSPTHGWP